MTGHDRNRRLRHHIDFHSDWPPYRHVLFVKYGSAIAWFAAALFLNLFAAVHMTCRLLFLKDTGRKLAHLDKQLRTGGSLSDELTRRLNE